MASSRSSSPAGSAGLDMFEEPSDFRPPTPPPTTAIFHLPAAPSSSSDERSPSAAAPNEGTSSTEEIKLNLVGSHPLWAHHLWNAAPVMSRYLNAHHAALVQGANVLELGAAAGLPCIVARKRGASCVVATDWPDIELMRNLRDNVESAGAKAEGYVWGTDPSKLFSHLPPSSSDGQEARFDLLLLSDLVFNHQAHAAMLTTLRLTLSTKTASASVPSSSGPESTSSRAIAETEEELPDGGRSIKPERPCALVFFSHHRPALAEKDMAFFEAARAEGWTCEEVGRWRMPPMFENDPGDVAVRGTVHGWRVYRAHGTPVPVAVPSKDDDQ